MNDDRTLRTSRWIGAPRARVFEAFRDPAQLTRWWGPAGFSSTFESFDFRPGGRWKFTLHGPDGNDYPNVNEFAAIEPDECVVIQHVEGHWFELTISLRDEGGGTRIDWNMEFPDAAERASLEGYVVPANEENLDRLTAVALS